MFALYAFEFLVAEIWHLYKRLLLCWEGLGAGGEGDNRGWDGWKASPTQWTWVWVNSGSWWWTGRPGVLRFMGLQRVGHDWATELNWPVCVNRTCGSNACHCGWWKDSLWFTKTEKLNKDLYWRSGAIESYRYTGFMQMNRINDMRRKLTSLVGRCFPNVSKDNVVAFPLPSGG